MIKRKWEYYYWIILTITYFNIYVNAQNPNLLPNCNNQQHEFKKPTFAMISFDPFRLKFNDDVEAGALDSASLLGVNLLLNRHSTVNQMENDILNSIEKVYNKKNIKTPTFFLFFSNFILYYLECRWYYNTNT